MQRAFQRMPAGYQDVIESYMKRMAESNPDRR
jgi:hypothetical protein